MAFLFFPINRFLFFTLALLLLSVFYFALFYDRIINFVYFFYKNFYGGVEAFLSGNEKMSELNTAQEIQQAIGHPREHALKKIYTYLNPRMFTFIERSPLMMLSSIDEAGWPTISPRGDAAGFVKSEGNQTLLIPEYKGNKLAFSLNNILTNNKLALLFTIPGVNEVLRVQGSGRILKEAQLCEKLASASQPALLVIEVMVDKAYFHCGKAMLRSHAWQSDQWPAPMTISLGTEVAENIGADEAFAKEHDKGVNERYVTDI